MNVFNHVNIQRLSQIFRADTDAPKVKPFRSAERSEPQDSVKLSDEARFVAALQKRLAESPDVRTEKVEALKRAIAEGRYHVSAEDIAEAILRENGLA